MAIRQACSYDRELIDRVADYIYQGKSAAAIEMCQASDTPIARMLEKGITRIGRPMSDVQSAVEYVANLEVSVGGEPPLLATIAVEHP